MLGTIVNATCIIVGSVAGGLLRRGIKEQYREALFTALGVCTVCLGANAFVHAMPKSEYPVLFIVSMALGTLVGNILRLDRLRDIGVRHEGSDESQRPRLADGLVTGCLLYCIGTFSMLGPVLSALQGDNTYLFTNATLDLISSTVLAATYGVGMAWAAVVLFVWQGMFYAVAYMSADIISAELMTELQIIGGLLITSSGIELLRLRNCHTLQMLPALLVPVAFFFLRWLFFSE